jgi:uncharacterized protein YndB with AHSA1/START domain
MCKTIKQNQIFNAPPKKVYELLTDPMLQSDLTGKPTTNVPKPGGKFTAYANQIEGLNVELVPGKRIVQAWKHKNFPEGIYSMATFNLEPTAQGHTKLTLTHRGVPKDLIPETEQNWRELYWDKMKAFFN